eukprot:gene32065-16598_t
MERKVTEVESARKLDEFELQFKVVLAAKGKEMRILQDENLSLKAALADPILVNDSVDVSSASVSRGSASRLDTFSVNVSGVDVPSVNVARANVSQSPEEDDKLGDERKQD